MHTEEFFTQTKSSNLPTVVDFWAPWCMPCRTTKPILEKLAGEYKGRVDFKTINADDYQPLLKELKIMGIPTVMVVQDGKEIKRYMGAQSADNYRHLFEVLASGRGGTSLPVAPMDRLVRLTAGAGLAMVSVFTQTWWLLPIAAIIMFTGIYDRCPIWQAIQARLKR